jgi:hypothetical protein
MALGSTQPLREMSIRNIPGKGRPARKADNLAAICEPAVYKMWSFDVSEPYGSPWPVTGIVLPLPFNLNICLANILFCSGFCTKIWYASSSLRFILHTLRISFPLIGQTHPSL